MRQTALALLCAAAFPSAALAQTSGTGQIPKSMIHAAPAGAGERLLQPVPPGYDVVTGQQTPMENMRLMVPGGQTIHNWTAMLMTKALPKTTDMSLATARDRLAQPWRAACKGYTDHTVSNAPVNGYPSASWTEFCPLNPQTGKPETAYYRVVDGKGSFYIVQETFRGKPSPADVKLWTLYMQDISACDDTDPAHPCPAMQDKP